MANSLLITCLALYSLVSTFCFGLNPNDWGPGSGWGSPSSMGSGPVGPGSPPGFGSGPGSPDYGSGSSSPPGFGYGPVSPGYGSGSGSPPGFGYGPGSPGYGSGSGSPPGFGYGPGSPDYGSGSSSPPGYGSGSGVPPGYGSGPGSPGYGSGSPPGSGSGAGWSTDHATFYGAPTGDGNDVNACGYKDLSKPPYLSLVTAVNDATFKNKMMGCGHCYQIKCSLDICSSQPVTVTVDDWSDVPHKFDLSGTSFRTMAIPGKQDQLQQMGKVEVQYRKVDCNYTGTNVAFGVDKSSSPYYFAMSVQYVNGDGLTGVDLKPAHTNDAWLPMKISWGGVYSVNLNGYSPPFSIRLTQDSKTVVAENVIPADYKITTYASNVNF